MRIEMTLFDIQVRLGDILSRLVKIHSFIHLFYRRECISTDNTLTKHNEIISTNIKIRMVAQNWQFKKYT